MKALLVVLLSVFVVANVEAKTTTTKKNATRGQRNVAAAGDLVTSNEHIVDRTFDGQKWANAVFIAKNNCKESNGHQYKTGYLAVTTVARSTNGNNLELSYVFLKKKSDSNNAKVSPQTGKIIIQNPRREIFIQKSGASVEALTAGEPRVEYKYEPAGITGDLAEGPSNLRISLSLSDENDKNIQISDPEDCRGKVALTFQPEVNIQMFNFLAQQAGYNP